MFVDQNGVTCFIDQNGITEFVDQNGILLTCSGVAGIIAATGSYALTGQSMTFATAGGGSIPILMPMGCM